jgi:TolA-binding protein
MSAAPRISGTLHLPRPLKRSSRRFPCAVILACSCVQILSLQAADHGRTNAAPSGKSPQEKAQPAERVEETQIDLANGFLSRDFFDLAQIEYQKYLDWFPKGEFVEEARYRLADCLRGKRELDTALAKYKEVQSKHPKGKFFARAAFRMAEIHLERNDAESALPKLKEAAARADSADLKRTAVFHQARLYVQRERPMLAEPLLRELLTSEKENPYLGFALIELGKILENSKSGAAEAGELFTKALETAETPALRREGGLRAIYIAFQKEQWKKVRDLHQKLIKLELEESNRGLIEYYLVRSLYELSDYQRLVRLLGANRIPFPKESQPEIDLVHAHSLRLLKRHSEAATAYRHLIDTHPSHPHLETASHEEIICLYTARDDQWVDRALQYISKFNKSGHLPGLHHFLANHFYAKEAYGKAAEHYGQISEQGIDPNRLPEIVYYHALSLSKIPKHEEARSRFDEFLKKFPAHPLTSSVLYLHAMSSISLKQSPAAESPLEQLVRNHPDAPEREAALFHLGTLYGQQEKNIQMRRTFQTLMKEFPKNPFIDEIQYWIGWSYFEEKKYQEALGPLEHARTAKPSEYGNTASSRIILAHYYLQQRDKLVRELRALPGDRISKIPPEVYAWAAHHSLKEEDAPSAEWLFNTLLHHAEGKKFEQQSRWGLAESMMRQSQWPQAVALWEAYLKDYSEPAEIIATKLQLVRGYMGIKDYTHARETAEDVLRLQPEGRNNAEARFLLGEVMMAEGNPLEAGRFFLSVSILYQDEDLTPRALEKAIEAFKAAGDVEQAAKLEKEFKDRFPNQSSKGSQ